MRCARSCLALLALALLPSSAAAQVVGSAFGEIWLSADTEERIDYNEALSGFTPFSFHVMVAMDFADDGRPSENSTNGLSGWEASLVIPPQITVTDRQLNPVGSTNAGADENWIVTMGNAVFADSVPFCVLTYTAQVNLAQVPEDLIISLGPATPSAGSTSTPNWIEAANGVIHPFDPSWIGNRFVVNCDGEDECGGGIDEPLGSLYLTASTGTDRIPYNEDLGEFPAFDVHLIVDIDFADIGRGGENPFNGMRAWESGLEVPAGLLITGVEFSPGQSINIGTTSNFIVGTGTLVVASLTPMRLAKISCILPVQTPAKDLVMRLKASSPSTLGAGVPLWQEQVTGAFHLFADWQDRFVINCQSAPECNSTPVALSGASIAVEDDAVVLRWESLIDDADLAFAVWRREGSSFRELPTPVQRGQGSSYNFVDADVAAGVEYAYRVVVSKQDQPLDQLELSITTPLPRAVVLEQNRPNPFNPRTTIRFALPEAGAVSVEIFDSRGRWVTTVLDGARPAGTTEVIWDGTDAAGQAVGSGVYHYRLRTASREETRRMLLVR